jgi:hypothetical protein
MSEDITSNTNSTSDTPDFCHLEKFRSKNLDCIPRCFNKCSFKPGQSFEARITHIYDPSKFWMVLKFWELEVFQKYLFRFYYWNGNKYRVPADKIIKDLYCVILLDNGYYRGVIVGIPSTLQTEQKIQVWCVDYGFIKVVEKNNVYYMKKECHAVPQFAVRSTLAGICPRKGPQWTSKDALEFYNLANDKILIGIIINVDNESQVLEVHIGEKNDLSIIPIHEILIALKHARYFHEKPEVIESKMPFEPKLQFPYLFPSHEALESGIVPTNVYDSEYQVQFSSLLSFLGRYYKAKDTTRKKFS